MKRVLSFALIFALLLVTCGCGGPKYDESILGVYTCYAVEVMDTQMAADEVLDGTATIELKQGGKGTMNVEDEKGDIKFTLDGENIKIEIEDETGEGTLSDGILTVELMGMKMYFALEGVEPPAITPADVGYYTIYSMKDGENSVAYDDLVTADMADLYIQLLEDGTGTVCLGDGDVESFTWTPGSITVDGDTVTYTLDGDFLTLQLDTETSMTFQRAEGQPPAASPSSEGSAEDSTVAATAAPVAVDAANTLTTEFWTLGYSGDWSYDKDNDLYESEGYCSQVTMNIEDGEDSLVSVYISASVEDASGYRSSLHDDGIDAKELAVNHSYPTETIGGVDFTAYDSEYYGESTKEYIARPENTGTTVRISVEGALDDARVSELLAGLTFTLPTSSEMDPPWFWDGTPFTTDTTHTASVGSYSITSTWFPSDQTFEVYDGFSGRIAAAGDTVYVLCDDQLRTYAKSAGSLTFGEEIPLDNQAAEMFADTAGNVYLSDYMVPFTRLMGNTQTPLYDEGDYVTMHPSGTWGIDWFASTDVQKVTISGNSASKTPMTLGDMSTVSHVFVTENYIFVSGFDAGSNASVQVFDTNGTALFTLGNTAADGSDELGSISAVAETANGIIGFDGNMRTVCYWDKNGTFLGSISAEDLFGTDYPWISSAVTLPDGSVLVGMTQERDDESGDELLIYQLSGF